MESIHIAVATITWARSSAEERLLLRSLDRLAHTGLPVAVADRGTAGGTFADALSRLPGLTVTVAPEPGLVPQVRASFALAATFGRSYLLYVEPDKELFFRCGLQEFLRRAPDGSGVGVVLASRSAESFQTFPPMQRYTEGVINKLCAELVGVGGDYSYGPFLVNRSLLPHVAALPCSLGWGWRHSTFLAAHRAGLRLVHVTDHYACPHDQRGEDDAERRHRMRQLSQNILGLIA